MHGFREDMVSYLTRLGVSGKIRSLYLGHVAAKNVVAGHGDIQLHAVYERALGTTLEDKLKVARH